MTSLARSELGLVLAQPGFNEVAVAPVVTSVGGPDVGRGGVVADAVLARPGPDHLLAMLGGHVDGGQPMQPRHKWAGVHNGGVSEESARPPGAQPVPGSTVLVLATAVAAVLG